VLLVAPLILDLLAQGDDGGVHAELEDGVDLAPSVPLDFLNAVDVPGFSTMGFSQMASAPVRSANRMWESCR